MTMRSELLAVIGRLSLRRSRACCRRRNGRCLNKKSRCPGHVAQGQRRCCWSLVGLGCRHTDGLDDCSYKPRANSGRQRNSCQFSLLIALPLVEAALRCRPMLQSAEVACEQIVQCRKIGRMLYFSSCGRVGQAARWLAMSSGSKAGPANAPTRSTGSLGVSGAI
jgi:hypothetical protein